jgi:hypothetical protein
MKQFLDLERAQIYEDQHISTVRSPYYLNFKKQF